MKSALETGVHGGNMRKKSTPLGLVFCLRTKPLKTPTVILGCAKADKKVSVLFSSYLDYGHIDYVFSVEKKEMLRICVKFRFVSNISRKYILKTEEWFLQSDILPSTASVRLFP
jgi:hypothetical protein